MRRPRNFRHLASKETAIARSVFEKSIPYSRVIISDGLGYGDRPFTLPEAMTGNYILHVGNGYYGMSRHRHDEALLIHELVHVWQGEHASWRWSYVFKSGWHQAGGGAYDYDLNRLKPWNSYNPEQQAQIVEDWFDAGMSESDPRFPFIRFWIRGDRTLRVKLPESRTPRLTRVQFKPHEEGRRIPADVLFDFDSARLKPEAKTHLNKAGAILNQHAKGRTLVIEGHTDSIGAIDYNRRLSERRARAVRQMLIGLGVENAASFQIKGCGETKPIAPNSSAEGRAENRRVEFNYL
jgi:outer membrane protein OmpA-like peptidoglycan-associated protein